MTPTRDRRGSLICHGDFLSIHKYMDHPQSQCGQIVCVNFIKNLFLRTDAYPEKFLFCPPGSYAAPLLKHGCAELASAQHTIPAKRVVHQLMVIGTVYPEKSTQTAITKCACVGYYGEVRQQGCSLYRTLEESGCLIIC